VHLGCADTSRNLILSQVVEESQCDNAALVRAQSDQQGTNRLDVKDLVEVCVCRPEEVCRHQSHALMSANRWPRRRKSSQSRLVFFGGQDAHSACADTGETPMGLARGGLRSDI
jgi:hypothetical protein